MGCFIKLFFLCVLFQASDLLGEFNMGLSFSSFSDDGGFRAEYSIRWTSDEIRMASLTLTEKGHGDEAPIVNLSYAIPSDSVSTDDAKFAWKYSSSGECEGVVVMISEGLMFDKTRVFCVEIRSRAIASFVLEEELGKSLLKISKFGETLDK